MEKGGHPPDSTFPGGGFTSANSGNNDRNFSLNQVHKVSHKISKPMRRVSNPLINDPHNQSFQTQAPLIPPPQLLPGGIGVQSQVPTQQQPPVYNINKSDFRDVVQRLTGSPAHDRLSAAPPPPPPMIQQSSKPTSSRLQKIRPPPLVQIGNRPTGPPQMINNNNLQGNVMNSGLAPNQIGFDSSGNVFFGGQRQPLSPLPPYPSHASADSPVSAYMRYLGSAISSFTYSPRWNNAFPPPQPQPQQQPPAQLQQQNIPPATQTSMGFPQFPNFGPPSPLPFGCIPSPRSTYLPLSPNGQMGFQQLPMPSPTVPLPSPKWKSI